MSARRDPPTTGSLHYLSTSDRYNLDPQRGFSSGAVGMQYSPALSSSAGNMPSSSSTVPSMSASPSFPVPLNFGLTEQPGSSSHQVDVGHFSLGGRGTTQDLTPVNLNTELSSALGLEPGPTVANSLGDMSRGYQHHQNPPASPMSPDYEPSALTLEYPVRGPRLMVREPSLDGLDAPGQSFSNGSGSSAHFHPSIAPALRTAPPSPLRARDQIDHSLLWAPTSNGLEIPPSPSSLSSRSTFSGLSTPQSIAGEVDYHGSPLTCAQKDYQKEGDQQWVADCWRAGQVLISSTPSSWPGNETGVLNGGLFPGFSPTSPSLVITTDVQAPAFGGISSHLPYSPSQHSQSFSSEDNHPVMPGGRIEGFPANSQPGPSTQSYSRISPVLSDYQQNGPGEIGTFPPMPHGHSATLGLPGYTLPVCINEGPSSGRHLQASQNIGPNGSHSTAGSATLYRSLSLNRRSGPPVTTRKRSSSCSQVLQYKRWLLRESISALEQRGLIPPAAALKDVMSLIIGSFSSNPTRQQIVDLLFEVLPENIGLEEAEVKKYFKDRVGHILSAPGSKARFAHTEGRWSLK